MIPDQKVSSSTLNFILDSALNLSSEDQVPQYGHLRFLGFLAAFRRYHMFTKIAPFELKDGTLNKAAFL